MKFHHLAFFVSTALFADALPHLDLDMTATEYRSLLETRERQNRLDEAEPNKDSLQPVMDTGKRFLDWTIYINENRPKGQEISLTNESTQLGWPIDQPRVSNPTIILDTFAKLKADMPKWLHKVLYEGAAFEKNPPVSDTEYVSWGLKVVRNYESASRWRLQEPFLGAYAARKKDDVRGHYFLSKETDLERKLKNIATLSQNEQTRLNTLLVSLCYITVANESSCKSGLQKVGAWVFFNQHKAAGQKKWDSFFVVPVQRPDVEWTGQSPNLFYLPFVNPNEADVVDFLVNNIEDEWKWNSWQLRLKFQATASGDTTHVKFRPGATPNVNGLGGSTITMDANQPLTEYNVRWTIRHEFGHVLGFPDCYIEFYDSNQKTMISYQLDISNLMCSRKGKLQEKHYDELKRVYFKNEVSLPFGEAR